MNPENWYQPGSLGLSMQLPCWATSSSWTYASTGSPASVLSSKKFGVMEPSS